jgi:endonuclease YncB( thermonuclease family)
MVRGFAGAALAAACVTTAWAQSLSGRADVIDGDTLRIAGETVRLHAIDAPEAGQRCADAAGGTWECGAAATAALERLARGGLVCAGRERDRYDRLVAKCFAQGRDVGAALVRSGAAFAYPEYGLDYVDAEKEAVFAGRGVWRGGTSRPEVLRAAAPDEDAPPGCAIKGNISSNGRIYHVPGQVHYARTRISEARGERWFCSEAAARAAGWRRARR